MRLLALVLLAALLLPGVTSAQRARGRTALILHDGVSLRQSPSTSSPSLAVLYEEQQVVVLGKKGTWRKICIWASTIGWVPSADVVFRKPWTTTSTYHAPVIHEQIHASGPHPLSIAAQTTSPTPLYHGPALVRTLAAGTAVHVAAWKQDKSGTVWYRIGSLWARGTTVRFTFPDEGAVRRNGVAVWTAASGKGMWLTLGTIGQAAPSAIVAACHADGISHLYLETAISPLGFHGRKVVGPLIDAAHHAHITVIAWVYPYLYDVAADVGLTRRVVTYRTVAGNGFDGVAADIERNVTLPSVRAYSQLVRAAVGPRYLLVGVTWPPQSFPTFPFAEMSHDYTLLAPMDYWHQTTTHYGLDYGHMRYGYAYGYRYAQDSIATMRADGVRVPIAPIGQTFDNYARLGIGPRAPSASEINGFLQGSKAGGAVGTSFFQWMTASAGEWRAIRAFHF
ncbi:MAG TPA: SH3 domain-containing protein [Chloroflexota bacterium]|nr:SH3 domain-containing protein [Chloroflexota bacterium]